MKLFTTLVLIFCVGGVISKTVKKSTENAAAIAKPEKTTDDTKIETEPNKLKNSKSKLRPVKKTAPSAIIAIEIVDPNDNTTKTRTSKRTIQSALGYGIPSSNSFGVTDKPKLVFYKYSQQNIPAHEAHSQQIQNQGYDAGTQNLQGYNQQHQNSQGYLPSNNLQIQKAVRYDLGSSEHVEYSKSSPQNYEPTTLFATFNQQGQVGGFTSNLPQQGHNVPVILLRVYTNQLGGAVYPNLPVTHPYAGLNNVNLQTMLNKFFDKHFQQSQSGVSYQTGHLSSGYQQNYYQPTVQQYYSQPQSQGQDYYLNQPNQYHQQYQDDIQQYQYTQQPYNYDNLPTHENYPSDAHTRVIFRANKVTAKGEVQQPQVLPSKISKYSQPQSYSSLEFRNPQPPKSQDYDDYDYPQYPPLDSTLKQNQDNQGYYYYKPNVLQQLQNYKNQLLNYQTQTQQDYQESKHDYQGSQQDYKGSQSDYQFPVQDYQSPAQDYQSSKETSGTLNDKGLIDTQKETTPYNYHAHPNTSKINQKRMITKLESVKRVNTPKVKEE